MPPGKRKKKNISVSLVLGSGGARGFAHIGVIQWLTENGVEIESISGSSMGALIGGIYAAGKLDVYTKWVRALEKKDVLRLLDFTFGSPGLLKGEKIMEVLRELIGDCNIEDLPISFTAVATDIQAEKEVWLDEGPLFDAIRASIGIPTLFTPFHHQGRVFIDGGLVNPIPIAPTIRDRTDLTIAVNLSAKGKIPVIEQPIKEKVPDGWKKYHAAILEFIEDIQQRIVPEKENKIGFFDVISQSMDIMQATITRFKLASYTPDVTIDIPKSSCTFLEFHRADALIEIGYQIAGDTLGDYFDKNGYGN
jgi:NTE family protein